MDIDQRNAHWAMRRRSFRAAEPTARAPNQPRFSRFASAMEAARAANAPQLSLYLDAPAQDIPATFGRDSRGPRPAPWRAAPAPGRPVARWLGIGSCVLLFGLLLVTMLTQPINAEIERLVGPWLDWQQGREAATPQTGRALPTTPEPTAGRDDPQSGSVPVLARDGFGVAAEPDSAAPTRRVTALAADDRPRSLPVPSLKPPLPDQ